MNKLKKTIDNILECFEKEYTLSFLEDLIMGSVIIHILKNHSVDHDIFLEYDEEYIKTITESEVFNILSKEVSSEIWEQDYIIPVVYECTMKKKNEKERYSIYYTPDWLVRYVVDRAIRDVINKSDNIDGIKILEPACGCGGFLLYIFDLLYNWYKEKTELDDETIVKIIIEEEIFGVDIDKNALKYCKYALLFKCIKILGHNIDLKFNLFDYDFLRESHLDQMKFNFILGNPPYLENRRINKYLDKVYLKKNFLTAKGRFDIYSLFIEKSITMLIDEGMIGFVLPASILSNNNFTLIRRIILDATSIFEITNLGESIFYEVDMNMAIIILKKIKYKNTMKKILCKNISDSIYKKNDIFNKGFKGIPQKYYRNMLNYVFDIDSSETIFKLRQRIFQDGYIKMNDVCEVVAGIATGNIRGKLLTYSGEFDKVKKILEGKNISAYHLNWTGLYLIDDKGMIDKSKGEYATFMRKEFILEEKILIRQTADRIICAYDDEGYYLLNTLYSLIVRENYREHIDILYILALLNSKLYSFLYRTLIREKGKVFPQLKIFHIQSSPIKIISQSEQHSYIDYVKQVIFKKKKLQTNKNLTIEKKEKIEAEIRVLLDKIDNLVYALFELTDFEIKEVEKEMGDNIIDIN